jgi:hypothetical protein
MRYSNIQESFFDFLKFIDEKEEKRIITRVEEFMNTNPDFTYDLEFNLPGLCPIERIAQSLAINEGKLRKVLKKVAKATDAIGIAKISSKVWSGDVLVTLNTGGTTGFKSSRGNSSYKKTYKDSSVYDSNQYVNESFLSSLKKAFGFGVTLDKEELDNASLEVVKFLYDRPVYDYHKKSDTPGLIFVSLLSEQKYTDIPFKTLEQLFKSDILDNCDVVNFKYKDIEGPVVVFGKPYISRKEYLVDNTSDFQEMLLIQEIQRKLISKGFLTDYTGNRSVITGELNRPTITAIIAFQEKYKIPTTKRGEINIETLRRLGVNLSFLGIDLKIEDAPLIDKLKKEASSTNTPIPAPKPEVRSMIDSPDGILFTSSEENEPYYSDDSLDNETYDEFGDEEIDSEILKEEPKASPKISQEEATALITGENDELVSELMKKSDELTYWITSGSTEISKILANLIGEDSKNSPKLKKEILESLLKFILKKDGIFFTNVRGFEDFNTGDLKSKMPDRYADLIQHIGHLVNNTKVVNLKNHSEISNQIKQKLEELYPQEMSNSSTITSELRKKLSSNEPKETQTGGVKSDIMPDDFLDSEEGDEKKTENLNKDAVNQKSSAYDPSNQNTKLLALNLKDSFDFLNTYTQKTKKYFSGSKKPEVSSEFITKFGKSTYGNYGKKIEMDASKKEEMLQEFLEFLLKKDGLFFTNTKATFANKFKDLSKMEQFKPTDYSNLISALISFINNSDTNISRQLIDKMNSLYAKYSNGSTLSNFDNYSKMIKGDKSNKKPETSKVFYLTNPNSDGTFNVTSANNKYDSTAHYYKFTELSNGEYEFEFVEDPTPIAMALKYWNKVIEPVCTSDNTYTGAKGIKTIQKGSAILKGDVYSVTQPLEIEYTY